MGAPFLLLKAGCVSPSEASGVFIDPHDGRIVWVRGAERVAARAIVQAVAPHDEHVM